MVTLTIRASTATDDTKERYGISTDKAGELAPLVDDVHTWVWARLRANSVITCDEIEAHVRALRPDLTIDEVIYVSQIAMKLRRGNSE